MASRLLLDETMLLTVSIDALAQVSGGWSAGLPRATDCNSALQMREEAERNAAQQGRAPSATLGARIDSAVADLHPASEVARLCKRR